MKKLPFLLVLGTGFILCSGFMNSSYADYEHVCKGKWIKDKDQQVASEKAFFSCGGEEGKGTKSSQCPNCPWGSTQVSSGTCSEAECRFHPKSETWHCQSSMKVVCTVNTRSLFR